ncbi:MAG: glycosyltransferase family 9 protein [Fusobacteria bacterium]|nr:glycosyltransferase family 9 protein [Fusobacteriota bacterium]
MKKILVIRFSSIGDIILTTPILRALSQKFPSAEIDILVLKQFEEAILGIDSVSKVILFDKEHYKGKSGIKKFVSSNLSKEYDCVVDLHAKIRSKLVAKFLGKPTYRYKKRSLWKTVFVKMKMIKYHVNGSIVNNYFGAVSSLGVENIGEELEFFISKKDKEKIPNGEYCVMAIGASKETKKWPVSYFMELAKLSNIPVKFVGDRKDFSVLEPLLAREKILHVENLCGKFSLKESGAVISNAKFVVCNDSALFHIARALKRNVFVFFGPTDPNMFTFTQREILLQANVVCQPCSLHGDRECPKKHFECMKNITPQEVKILIDSSIRIK